MQIMDYGIALKCDSGKFVLQRLLPLIKLFVMLKRNSSDSYIQSILAQMMVLYHQKKYNMPAFKLFTNNFSLFNEESGEMSFAVLGRMVHGNATKKDIDHMSQAWVRIHDIKEMDDAFQQDNGRQFKAETNYRKVVNPDGEEVNNTVYFFKGKFREMQYNKFTVYPREKGAFASKATADKGKVLFARVIPFWQKDTSAWLQFQADKAGKFTSGWGFNFRHIWPEMDPIGHGEINPDDEVLQPEAEMVDRIAVPDAPPQPQKSKTSKKKAPEAKKNKDKAPKRKRPQKAVVPEPVEQEPQQEEVEMDVQQEEEEVAPYSDDDAEVEAARLRNDQRAISPPRVHINWNAVNPSNVVEGGRRSRVRRRPRHAGFIRQPLDQHAYMYQVSEDTAQAESEGE